MAVTLVPDDLKYPVGELQPAMFPDGDIDDALVTWLTEAEGLTTDNTIAEHYIYWRGYTAVANRLTATPSSQSTGQGNHSVSWSDARIKELRSLANYHKAEYDRLTEATTMTQPRAYFGRVRVL